MGSKVLGVSRGVVRRAHESDAFGRDFRSPADDVCRTGTLRVRRVAAALLLAAMAVACSKDSAPIPNAPTSGVVAVVVSGSLSPVKAGESVQLSATAMLANGGNRSVTTEATWQSTNSTVAVVSAVGGDGATSMPHVPRARFAPQIAHASRREIDARV